MNLLKGYLPKIRHSMVSKNRYQYFQISQDLRIMQTST